MIEKKYTLEEAVVELMKQDCSRDHHSPHERIATIGDPVGFWSCACGHVTWKPEQN